MPRFSILVPTRRRPDTLRYTLETAVTQRFQDYELVVANNTGDKATSEVVDHFRSQNYPIREVCSDQLLSMSNNWEMGINACTGEYVTVLGDDDALLPETLSYANYVIQETGVRLLNWPTHEYFWPGAATARSQNHLMLLLGEENIVTHNSYAKLVSMYNYSTPFNTYPMIYNGVVHRDVITATQRHCGAYFASDNPDVFSAIANLHFTKEFIRIGRPLGVRGTSRYSNGNAMVAGGARREEAMMQFQSEAGKLGQGVHPLVFESPVLDIPVAGTFLTAADFFFPDDPVLRINMRLLIEVILIKAARSPDIYDLSVEHVHKLAQMHNIPADSYVVPPRPPPKTASIARTGPMYNEEGRVIGLVINGEPCGLRTVADAARMITASVTQPFI